MVSFFGAVLPNSLLEEFLLESKHPIYELEIFPVVIAAGLWWKFSLGKLVMQFLDNDAAKSSFVRANAATKLGCALVNSYTALEYRCRFSPWFARVASHSNPEDDPSRLNFEAPLLRNAYKADLILPSHLGQWGIYGCAET